jgi:hypothetical protein
MVKPPCQISGPYVTPADDLYRVCFPLPVEIYCGGGGGDDDDSDGDVH